jgi:hypothetical protein
MPVDPTGLFEAVMSGLAQVPSAVIAAALIAGPTAIWLIARFLNPPDVATRDEGGLEELLWVCPACRSINEDRIASCYRCPRLRTGEGVPLVAEPAPTRPAPGVGIAVGPGRPVLASDNAWVEQEVARASNAVDDGGQPEKEDVPAGEPAALTFEAVILEPRVKASGRPGASEPTVRRTRRKPPGTSETKPKRERKTGTG